MRVPPHAARRSRFGRRAAATLLLSVLAFLVAACGENGSEAGLDQEPEETHVIRISGSGTCRPLVELLAAEYEHRYGAVSFRFLPPMHSAGGVQGVIDGELDIGLVSRDLTDAESASDLEYHVLSHDGLVVAAHSEEVGIDALTSEQLVNIYSGAVANWRDLGGEDQDLIVLDRNEQESAKLILRQYVLKDVEITDLAVTLNQESDMVDGLVGTPGTIGYLSLGYAVSHDLPLHILALDGVAPSPENVEAGRYAMQRPLGIVHLKEAPHEVQAFVTFMKSEQAAALMRGRGFVPALFSEAGSRG